MYFKKADHRHDRVGPQIGRTIVIARFEMSMCEINDILQVILEFSDKILREFYDSSVTIRFAGSETVNIWSPRDTHDSEGELGMSARLYRVRMSWSST